MDTAPAVATLSFEGFVLDLRGGSLLTTAGEKVPLRRQSFELLRLLAENAGRLLDRDTINRAIWSDVAVTDDSITQCVRDIRRAIGDDVQQVLKTVPRRGYLLPADVTSMRDPPVSQPAVGAAPLPDKPSIAVLAFTNMSGDLTRNISLTALQMTSSRSSRAAVRCLSSHATPASHSRTVLSMLSRSLATSRAIRGGRQRAS